MQPVRQVQTFGDIRLEGQGNTLTINQVVQIAVAEVKTRPFISHSPYPGLRRFEERNKDFFFGRDRQIAQLVHLVARLNLVLLAGASGSGKSSVVRAGLLPQLTMRLTPGRFRALVMTPDRDPFASLKAALQTAGVAQRRLDVLEARTAEALVTVLTTQCPADEQWLLFIDQFEEIFTLCSDVRARGSFLCGLGELAQLVPCEVKTVLAMRADFFDRFGPHPEFAKQAEPGLCLMVDMQASELRAAIEQPAAKNGVVFEDGLVEQIIADVKSRPGALPLLQYTLDLLWRAEDPAADRTLNAASYHQIGGIEGALRLRADALYRFTDSQRQTPRLHEQQEQMRTIFLRLVDLTSQGADARAVSRRAPLTDFSRAEEQQLIAELVDEKLLVTDAERANAAGEQSATVELVHESLLSAWPILIEWIEQAREVLYVRNRLAADARRYAEVKHKSPGQADDELWGGTRLQQAIELRTRGDFSTVLGGLSEQEESFLDASVFVRERRQREEEARQRQVTRARRLLFGGSLAAALAVSLGLGFGLLQQRRAKEEVQRQLLGSYVERGRQALFKEQSPIDALPWLHRAYQGGSRDPILRDLIAEAMYTAGAPVRVLVGHSDVVTDASFSPDGRLVVTMSKDRTARIWEVGTGRTVATLAGHLGDGSVRRDGTPIDCGVNSASFSPDSRRVVTASDDKTAKVWDAQTGRLLATLTGGQPHAVRTARFSPDGTQIVTTGYDAPIRTWDAQTGHMLAQSDELPENVWWAEFSPDGKRLLVSVIGAPQLRDARTGSLVADLTEPEAQANPKQRIERAAFSSEGHFVVTERMDKSAQLWDAESGRMVARFEEKDRHRASFSFQGKAISARYDDWAIRNDDSGLLLIPFNPALRVAEAVRFSPDARLDIGNPDRYVKGHDAVVNSERLSPDGRYMITASADKTARIWLARTERPQTEVKGIPSTAVSASFSADGRYLAIIGHPDLVWVWDSKTGSALELKGHTSAVQSASFSADGARVVTASDDKTARVWNARDGRLLQTLTGHQRSVMSARFSPDGQRIVTIEDRRVRVWDSQSGQPLGAPLVHPYEVVLADFTPDGKRILSAGENNSVILWELLATDRWRSSSRFSVPIVENDFPNIRHVSLGPEGLRAFASTGSDAVRHWDLQAGRLLAEFKGHKEIVKTVHPSPDGQRVLTIDQDGCALIWEAMTGRQISSSIGCGGIFSASFSPDGRRVVTLEGNGLLRIKDVSPAGLSAGELGKQMRCYWPLRFAREDSDVLLFASPTPNECMP